MAAEKNSFNETVNSLFKGMDSFISSKTVVGDAIYLNDTIILPLVDVSFGVGAGAFASEKSNNGGGGMGGKISPNSVLVIQGENIRLVNIKNLRHVLMLLPPSFFLYRTEPQSSPTVLLVLLDPFLPQACFFSPQRHRVALRRGRHEKSEGRATAWSGREGRGLQRN